MKKFSEVDLEGLIMEMGLGGNSETHVNAPLDAKALKAIRAKIEKQTAIRRKDKDAYFLWVQHKIASNEMLWRYEGQRITWMPNPMVRSLDFPVGKGAVVHETRMYEPPLRPREDWFISPVDILQ